MNEQDIFNRIRLITDKLTQKQQLQSLAKSNGIEINELELTEDTVDAVVISVIALMLAKMNQDERYRKLCDFGMQKRSLKVEIINDYKQRANMLYNQFKTGNTTPVNDIVDDVPYDESYVDDDIDDDTITEGFGFTTKKNICNRVCEQIDIIDPFLKELHKKLDAGEIRDPKTFRKWYRQDVKVSYGYTGGSTTSGDSFGGTTYSYEYGEPTLENYIGRAISVLRMSTRDRYVGKVFTSSEHTMLTELHELLSQMKKDMTSACKDGFNTFKEYNPNVYKNTLTKIIEELTKWDEQSKDVYDMCTKKLG